MGQITQQLYEFGPYRIDLTKRLLMRDGEAVPLTPKCFDILLALIERGGEVVGKEALMSRVWPDSFVEEGNLTYNISVLRKALGEKASEHQYILTIPGRGYRFSTAVREISDEGTGQPADLSKAVPSKPEAQTTEARTAARRIYPFRQRGVILAGFTLLLLAIVAIYFSTARKSEQASSGLAIKSLAVLPFKPLVVERRDESLELGMAETLINKLSGIREIIVRPISAVREYSAPNQDPLAAGRELGVDAVLDASIQWDGEHKIRVAARLLSVRDGSTIWTDKCDERCSNVFELQDSIAERVARALSLSLTSEEKKQLAKHYTENTEAYQLYLRGQYHHDKWTQDGWNKAIENYQKAILKDPNYALAYAGMSATYAMMGLMGEAPPRVAYAEAKMLALKALDLDDTLAGAHRSLGFVRTLYDWNWPEAEREYKRAIEIDPSDAQAHLFYAYHLVEMGRPDEAIAEIKDAEAIEPLNPLVFTAGGDIHYYARRNDEAIEEFRKALDLEPNYAQARGYLGLPLAQLARYGEAIAELTKGIPLTGANPELMGDLGYVYAVSGRRDDALRMVNELTRLSRRRYIDPVCIGIIYVGLNEKDQAFEWLERGFQDRSAWMLYLKVAPQFDSLRSDARFKDLMRRVGLPQ